jgi:glycerol kinase
MLHRVILAIDQGTTGTTCLVVDDELHVIGRGYREIRQHFPHPGWVEHDPEELWQSVVASAEGALADARVSPSDVTAIGVTNQRETTIVWDRRTGDPVHAAIVWQDRRTADRCRTLPADLIRSRTGLVPDPYFSATKLEWILERATRPQTGLAFGTVDAWLVWKLTRGAAHVVDVTNASRTMLFDLKNLRWDDDLLELFRVDPAVLPTVVASSGVVGEAEILGMTIPIAGIAGDQQASLFGHGCFSTGDAKATYGTGSFILVNAGKRFEPPPHGLLATAAAVAPGRTAQYALEGSVLVAGAAVQWLRDGLGLIRDAAETEKLATQVASTGGVVFVPALTGLGSPHWDSDARGVVSGITSGTTRAHLARAALEAIAFQVVDVLDSYPGEVAALRADGGATRNAFLMQFQADLLGVPVDVAEEAETTAIGAAALAGLAVGAWPDLQSLTALMRLGTRYEPTMSRDEAASRCLVWHQAVRRTLSRAST